MSGAPSRSGRGFAWSPQGIARNLQVRVQVRDGRSVITIEERLSPLAGAIWGGLFGGLTGAGVGAVG